MQLLVRLKDFNDSFMTWHLRDTSRLRAVQILGHPCQALAGSGYCIWVSKLLQHLSFRAPALRSLDLMLLGTSNNQIEGILPLIGALSQLQTLVLREWRYSAADIAAISHLTRLPKLKVPLQIPEMMGMPMSISKAASIQILVALYCQNYAMAFWG